VGSIDRHLAVVALNPAVSAFEDVAVGIGEVALGFALDLSGGIGGEVSARHGLGIDLRFKVWDGLPSRLGLLQGQRLGGLGPLSRRSSPAGGVGSDLGGLSLSRRLVRTGLGLCSLLLSAAGLPLPLAGMVSGRLRFQFGFGLAQHLDAVLPPPQLYRCAEDSVYMRGS